MWRNRWFAFVSLEHPIDFKALVGNGFSGVCRGDPHLRSHCICVAAGVCVAGRGFKALVKAQAGREEC
jgi:hypothetical protein